LADAPVALRFGTAEEEVAALRVLALCDLSALPKFGVKGAGAETWLRERGVDVPDTTYDTRRLADGGLIARLGSADFFLEGVLPHLSEALAQAPPQVYRVERHDSTFLLGGSQALAVLAQMCSIDFRTTAQGRLLLTRAAGASAVLPEVGEVPCSACGSIPPSPCFWGPGRDHRGTGGKVPSPAFP
jgi:sarcosine oxidase subunit gamma